MPAHTTTTALADLHHEVHGTGTPLLFHLEASGEAAHVARAAARSSRTSSSPGDRLRHGGGGDLLELLARRPDVVRGSLPRG